MASDYSGIGSAQQSAHDEEQQRRPEQATQRGVERRSQAAVGHQAGIGGRQAAGHTAGGADQAAEDHRGTGLFRPIIGATNGVAIITRIALTRPAAIDSAMTSELAPIAAPVTGPTM